MSNTDKGLAGMKAQNRETACDHFHKTANARKRTIYWIGFLEGALSSGRIEDGESSAIFAEAKKFAEFFNDPDASDLAEDISADCFSSEADMMEQLKQIISVKKHELQDDVAFSEVDEMNEFLGFCAGVICDGKVLQREVQAIQARFKSSTILMEAPPFRSLKSAVVSALRDKILTNQESEEIREWISHLVGDGFADTGLPNIGAVAKLGELITDPDQIVFDDAVFVLTGPMKMGPRSHIEREIQRAGGIPKSGVSKKTNYVVVSSEASRHWTKTHFGTKIERARELIEEGVNISFVSEIALSRALEATRG